MCTATYLLVGAAIASSAGDSNSNLVLDAGNGLSIRVSTVRTICCPTTLDCVFIA